MLSLGYEQYVSQGGDWGMTITRIMGQIYPTHLKASHVNLIPSVPPKFSVSSPFAYLQHLIQSTLNWYTPAEKAGLERTQWNQRTGRGYHLTQSTKPQTLGYLLADSPVGLLAWVYEKLVLWTDGYAWTEEEVCTWVSVYWFSTAGPAASVRIYYESARGEYPGSACSKYNPDVKLVRHSWQPRASIFSSC